MKELLGNTEECYQVLLGVKMALEAIKRGEEVDLDQLIVNCANQADKCQKLFNQ